MIAFHASLVLVAASVEDLFSLAAAERRLLSLKDREEPASHLRAGGMKLSCNMQHYMQRICLNMHRGPH